MSAYVVVDVDVHDLQEFERYRVQVPPLVERHGGEYLARGGAVTVEEGNVEPHRVVILRFRDRAGAQAFFDDPDYAPVKAIRFASATSWAIIVDGVD